MWTHCTSTIKQQTEKNLFENHLRYHCQVRDYAGFVERLSCDHVRFDEEGRIRRKERRKDRDIDREKERERERELIQCKRR